MYVYTMFTRVWPVGAVQVSLVVLPAMSDAWVLTLLVSNLWSKLRETTRKLPTIGAKTSKTQTQSKHKHSNRKHCQPQPTTNTANTR